MNIKKSIIFITIIFIAIFLILVFLFLLPIFGKISRHLEDFIVIRKEFVSLETKADDYENAKKDYQVKKQEIDKIDSLFADPDAPIEIIQFLEEISKQANVSISISPVSSKDSSDIWDWMGFQINLTGEFNGLLEFLEKMETSPYLIETTSIIVKGLDNKTLGLKGYESFSLGDISASLNVRVYIK